MTLHEPYYLLLTFRILEGRSFEIAFKAELIRLKKFYFNDVLEQCNLFQPSVILPAETEELVLSPTHASAHLKPPDPSAKNVSKSGAFRLMETLFQENFYNSFFLFVFKKKPDILFGIFS